MCVLAMGRHLPFLKSHSLRNQVTVRKQLVEGETRTREGGWRLDCSVVSLAAWALLYLVGKLDPGVELAQPLFPCSFAAQHCHCWPRVLFAL